MISKMLVYGNWMMPTSKRARRRGRRASKRARPQVARAHTHAPTQPGARRHRAGEPGSGHRRRGACLRERVRERVCVWYLGLVTESFALPEGVRWRAGGHGAGAAGDRASVARHGRQAIPLLSGQRPHFFDAVQV